MFTQGVLTLCVYVNYDIINLIQRMNIIPSKMRLLSHTIELSADVVVVVDMDIVDSRCRIGEMAARMTTKLGTVTLQVGLATPTNLRL